VKSSENSSISPTAMQRQWRCECDRQENHGGFKKVDQPSDISIAKLISAVKSGVQYAGEQMIKSGADLVEQMKEKAKKQ
jgi:hypothetical protein